MHAVMRMAVLDRILATGSFKIKKWFCSNTLKKRTTHQETTDYDKDLGQIDQVSLDSDDSVKTLGVCWNPGTDTITFRVKDRQEETLTKRRVLSRIAMLYDPLGLAAVVTIRARIAMQNLWRLDKIGWDDRLPPEHSEIWQDLFVDLGKLDTVQFPRCVKPDMASGVPELHVFADASTSAYGAVAYMMWHSTGGTSVCLLTAKGRVAPIRQTTVPRLELMAAPNDPQVLTPNHFLLGRASVNIPQGPYEESRNLHKRFEFVQGLVNRIWKRFIKEYIPTLMKRTTWILKGRQVTIGDIVLLTNPDIPRGKWDLGRITDVYPGHDGIVRNVNVRTKSGQYKRSVQKCCIILEASEQ